jgi:hypothetical protein
MTTAVFKKYGRVAVAISIALIMLLPFVYLLLGALASTFSLTGTIDLSS